MHVICMCIFKMRDLLCISGASIDVKNGYCPSNKSTKLYRDVATGPNLCLTIDHMSLLHSLDFGVIQWSWYRTHSGWNLLPLSTLHLCRFSFNMQVMILVRSYYGTVQPSLHICRWVLPLHYHYNSIFHRTWG